MSAPIDPSRFVVTSPDDGAVIVRPAFDIALYTTHILTTIAPAVTELVQRYLDLVEPSSLRWYLIESSTRHKAVTKRTYTMMSSWFDGSKPREIVNIELRDGDDFTAPAERTLFIHGREASHIRHTFSANVVRFVVPFSWGVERRDELVKFALAACETFPFQSGHAGYVLQTTKYSVDESEQAAWDLSMRYRGFDIRNEVRDFLAVRNAAKGAGWLTTLADDLIGELGGIDSIRTRVGSLVQILPVRGGAVLQAGAAPVIGDPEAGDDLSPYRAVYEVIAPLVARACDRYGAFHLARDHVAGTEAWLRRLATG